LRTLKALAHSTTSIWKPFIPTEFYKTFELGGYYAVEVVPGELAVISLNTLYFFEGNTGEHLRCDKWQLC
jgi:hypothetical protein